MTLTPRPYQLVGRDFLAGRRHALLADEMRVGKTPQAILAAQAAKAKNILVLCPAIAVRQWHAEFARWWPDVDCPRVYSYNRALLQATEILSQRWDVAIIDEAHFAKNPEAARTKLVYGKGGIGWHADRMWSLSGTPAPKHAGELWPMLRAFGAVKMGYPEFVAHYCTVNAEGRITGTREQHIPELKAILATVMLRRTRKEVAPDMPDIAFDFLNVVPEVQRDLTIPANIPDDKLLEWVESQASKTDKEDRIAVALAKIQPLGDEIDFALGNGLLSRTVVFGWHVEPLVVMTRSLNSRGFTAELINGATPDAERQKIMTRFRNGETQVVCANIAAAGTAVDLSAASHGYFLELDWVPGNNVQAANRLISMDKKEPVTMDVVSWPGSFDDRIQRVLLRRARELATLY